MNFPSQIYYEFSLVLLVYELPLLSTDQIKPSSRVYLSWLFISTFKSTLSIPSLGIYCLILYFVILPKVS